ncbi:hypothetical protein LMG26696_01857 [Achromobacter pulmonis]|uniref:hypothetical protein n=1 Tax=Achromobacter pulmonis TaxID=1389932 RepID=UPI001465D0FE|nr:hypothetical protein [Achromobacter pulmonis]CAB3638211.1 hypothetical protein LMG26696_01857 [Achromobacter pulmonis]
MKNALRTIPVTIKNGTISLNLKLADVQSMAIVGVDLVALMRDGTRLLLPGLAVRILERPSPTLQFLDQQLSGADLFTKVDIDSTALKDATEALQVPVSEPTSSDNVGNAHGATEEDGKAGDAAAGEGTGDLSAGAVDGLDTGDASKGESDKSGDEPQAWYQEYGWILGLVGLAGLALGLSSSKKKNKDEDKPAEAARPDAPAGDTPAAPDDSNTPPTPPEAEGEKPAVTVTGGIAAGVFNHAETLSVTLYGAQGQELARGELVVGPNGQVLSYRAELPADYVGPVRVVVTDGARDGLGFIDEYRQAMALGQGMTAEQAERFASADFAPLSAIAWRAEGQMDMRVSVTPLTELAARLLQAPADPTQALDGVTAEQVAAMAAAVADFAKTFTGDTQINDILGPVIAINADNFGAGAADAQAYGRALAGMAGLDAVSGALEQTLRLLTRGLERADDGTLRVAQSVEGAILLSAMQQANTLLAGLDDHSLFDAFVLPEVPWSTVTATFADAAPSEVSGIDALGSATQPSVTVSWDADGGARLAAGQTVALYLLDGRQVAAHTLSDEDIAAGHLTLNAPDYGEQALGADGVKRLFVTVADDAGLLIARSELHTYGLVSAEVDAITGLSADTGLSNSDFITNQPVQAVSGTYRGTLGENTHIEVSADGGRTWVATRVTAGADGAGGTWVSESLRLDATAQDEDARLLTRVSVSGGDGEQALTLAGASHDFVLDVTPPEAVVASIDSISAPLPGALDGFLFSQASQTIRGTVDGTLAADERVVVSIDGGNTWIAGEADGANWQVTVGFSKHGPGEILARVSDMAGNVTAAQTHPYQFTEASLEGVIPTQAVDVQAVTDHIGDSQADPYDFMGELRPGMSTDDRRPTFTGTVSADLQGDQVLVLVDSINGGPERLLGYANVAPGEDGQLPQWSFTPVADMAVGRHQVLVKVFSPSQNAWSAPYPEGVDANTPDAKSNWGAWDVNVQSITFDGVIIPGVDPLNLLTAPSLVTESTQPILTGMLGSLLGPDESVMIYDTADNGRTMLLGAADILPEQNGAGARWRFEFRDDAQLRDGAHTLRAVIQQPDDDNGVPRSLLSAGTPPVIVSTELPEQEVTIARVMDDVGIYTGEITSGTSTDDTTPSLTGTVSAALRPGQTLQVRVTDVTDPEQVFTYEPELDQDSLNWSLAVSPALPVGHYHLAAGVVNGGGAMGARSAHFDLLINSLTFTNLDDAAGPIVGNVFANGEPFVTDDRAPVFGGQLGVALADGEVVQVVARHDDKETVLGNAIISADDEGGLTWYLALDSSQGLQLEDGQSTLSARIVNVDSDEVRLAVDREIVVDTAIPDTAVAITEVRDQVAGSNGFVGPLAAGQSTDDTRPLISGMLLGATTMPLSRAVQIIDRMTSPSGAVTEQVLGLATMDEGEDGTWTFTPPENLAIGSHAFSARVINIANGELGPESASIAVRENRLSFASVLDHVGALQGNLLDARIFAQPVSTDDSRPSMSGELGVGLGPDERVAIYDSLAGGPATRLGVATVTGTSWVFTPESVLSDGVHTFQARLERTQPGSAPQVLLSASTPSITIDGTAVPVTQTMLELRVSDNNGANGSQTGIVTFRGSTDDARPVVSGRLSAPLTAGLQVQVFASSAGNAERLLGTADMNGVNWTYRVGQNLPFGPSTILARVVAANSGLTSNTLFTTVNINGITLTEIAETSTGLNVLDRDGHGTGLNDVTLRGRLSAPLLVSTERVAVYAKDGDATLFSPIGLATVASNGIDWTFRLPERQGTAQTWREGRHELSVRIEDTASRVAYALAITDFTVDSQPPTQTASITGYVDGVGTSQGVLTEGVSTDETRGVVQGTLSAPIDTHTRRVMVYARAADGGLVLLGEAGVTDTDWKFQAVQHFVPGLHTLVARVENIATGGVGASSEPFDVRVQQVSVASITDSAAPDVNILAPAFNGAAKHGALVVGGRLGAALAPGEEVRIFIDGEEQAGTATVTESLDWSFTLPADTPLAQGSHTIVAQVVGAEGAEIRVGSTARTVYIDDSAPVETVIISSARDNQGAGGLSFTGENVSGVASDDPLPRLQGTVSAPLSGGAAVAVYGQMPGQDAPVFLGFATVAADATWTFQVDRELPFGDTVFTARAVNRADPQHLQGASSPEFVVHEQAVSITALVDHHGAVTGDLFQAQAHAPGRGIALLNTDDLRPTLYGRVAVALKAGEVLSLFRGNAKLGEAVFDSDGLSWSFTPPADVAQGTAPFSAALFDFAGRSLISARTPDVTIARLGADHTITITAVQDANNRPVMVDKVISTAPVNVLADGVLDDSRPILSGTLDRPLATTETVHVYAIDSQGGKHDLGAATTTGSNWSLTPAISLPAGMNTLQAAIENSTDRNDAVLSAPVKVNVVSPSGIELDDMSAWGAVPSGRPTMHGSVNTDAIENLSVRILIDGVDAGTATVEAGGSWTFQPVFPLTAGTHQVEYVLLNNGTPVDAVQTEAPRVFTVSSAEAPSFSVTLAGDGQPILTDQGLVVLSGTASAPVPAGMGIMISVDNKDVGLAGVDASGENWSYTLWAQSPGQHAVAARPINLGTLVAFEDGVAHTSIFQNQLTIDTPAGALALSGGILAMLADSDKDVALAGRLTNALPTGYWLQVRRDDVVLGKAEITEDGNWHYAIKPDQQAIGLHRYSVLALPSDVDVSDAQAVSFMRAQARLNFTDMHSGPDAQLYVALTSLTDDQGVNVPATNATIHNPLPALRGTISQALDPLDQIVVYGRGRDGQQTRLGEARMLTATTWEFQVKTPLPQGGYTLIAKPENRLTHVANEIGSAATDIQLQDVTIVSLTDAVGTQRGNVLDTPGHLTDDGLPTISGRLSAPVREGEQYLRVSDTVGGVTTVLGRAEIADPRNPLAWRFQPTAPLANGSHTISVEMVGTNNDRVQAGASVSIMMDGSTPGHTVQITRVRDDDGPVVGNVAANGAIAYQRPLVSGTVSAALSNAQVVRIWGDDGAGNVAYLGQATVNGTNWTWRSDTDMDFGSVRLFATVDNAAKSGVVYNEEGVIHGRPSAPFSFRLQDIQDVQALGADGKEVDASTSSRQFTLSGKLATPLVKGEYIEIRDGTSILGRATVDADLNWHFPIGESLTNGQHVFKISILGNGNPANVPLVFQFVSINVYEAASDPLQAGLIEAVIALPGTQVLLGNSPFDTWAGNSVRPGQSVDGARIGIFGSLAVAPRAGDQVQVYDNDTLLGTASVSGLRWWYNADKPLSAGEHRLTLTINGMPVPPPDSVHDAVYPIEVFDADAIRIDALTSQTDRTQALSGSLQHALGRDEVLGVYRTLNGEKVRLGDATVQQAADAEGRIGWSFTPTAGLGLGLGEQTLTLQVEGATHTRVAASQSATVSLDKDAIDAVTAILSVATPRADGLAGVEPGASVSNAAVVVSGTLDRDLVGSERVALYDGDLRVGYATLGASGRNWTYVFTGMNNGAHNLTAVVENNAGRSGTHSGAFALNMAAQSPGQLVTLTSGIEEGTPLGSAVGVDTHGFSAFAWNTTRVYWDINQLRNTADMVPTGSGQVPALNFANYNSAFIPGVPYQVIANYLGGGWFHVDAQQAGMWSFRTPVSDDFATLSVDGQEVFTAAGFYANGRGGSTELAPGWHYLRMEVGNTGASGYWRLQWRRPGETDYTVAREVYTGPTEHALALGPTDKSHHVKLNFALSAPLGKDEQLQVIDLTAHRVGDGLRLQFWNLPADANRSFDAALALMAQTPAAVSRMADSLLYDRQHPFDTGVITSAASMLGHASGWFHVAQNQAGTWLFRTTLSSSQVQLKIDGHTLQAPGEALAHAQYATTHLEAGWHHLDSILFQGSDTAIDWRISVLRPGDNAYGLLTDFAQFEAGVLGNASLADAAQPTAYSFDATVDDGGSHTLVAVVDNNGAHVAPEDASESRVFLANGAFGIVDKAVAVTGDGQTVDFAAVHGAINRIDLDADHATHTQGNTLVIGANDVRQADIGAAADMHSDLLNAAFHQLIVQGGQHDVLRLADAANATAWQESGTIAASTDTPAYTVFTAPDQALQLIVQTDIALDLNGVLRSTAHPVI